MLLMVVSAGAAAPEFQVPMMGASAVQSSTLTSSSTHRAGLAIDGDASNNLMTGSSSCAITFTEANPWIRVVIPNTEDLMIRYIQATVPIVTGAGTSLPGFYDLVVNGFYCVRASVHSFQGIEGHTHRQPCAVHVPAGDITVEIRLVPPSSSTGQMGVCELSVWAVAAPMVRKLERKMERKMRSRFVAHWLEPKPLYDARADCASRGGKLAQPRTLDEQRSAANALATIPDDWCSRCDPTYAHCDTTCSSWKHRPWALIDLHDLYDAPPQGLDYKDRPNKYIGWVFGETNSSTLDTGRPHCWPLPPHDAGLESLLAADTASTRQVVHLTTYLSDTFDGDASGWVQTQCYSQPELVGRKIPAYYEPMSLTASMPYICQHSLPPFGCVVDLAKPQFSNARLVEGQTVSQDGVGACTFSLAGYNVSTPMNTTRLDACAALCTRPPADARQTCAGWPFHTGRLELTEAQHRIDGTMHWDVLGCTDAVGTCATHFVRFNSRTDSANAYMKVHPGGGIPVRAFTMWVYIQPTQVSTAGWKYMFDGRNGYAESWFAWTSSLANGSNIASERISRIADNGSATVINDIDPSSCGSSGCWRHVYVEFASAHTATMTVFSSYSNTEDLTADLVSMTFWNEALSTAELEALEAGQSPTNASKLAFTLNAQDVVHGSKIRDGPFHGNYIPGRGVDSTQWTGYAELLCTGMSADQEACIPGLMSLDNAPQGLPVCVPVIGYGSLNTIPSSSCLDILRENPGASDGVHIVLIAGESTPTGVTCDMTNGGWTLVASLSQASNNWLLASAHSDSTSGDFKLSDAAINAAKSSGIGQFRVTLDLSSRPLYVNPSCVFDSTTSPSTGSACLQASFFEGASFYEVVGDHQSHRYGLNFNDDDSSATHYGYGYWACSGGSCSTAQPAFVAGASSWAPSSTRQQLWAK